MSTAPTEAHIQQSCVMWYRNTFCLEHHQPRCLIFSVPNESSGPRASRLIQTGLYPGCSDLVVIQPCPSGNPFAKYKTFFFEVKTDTGIQSPKQKKFEGHCRQMEHGYFIVRSLDQFKKIILGL